jgi:hypothetical protein
LRRVIAQRTEANNRVYIPRYGVRKISNEAEVISTLKRFNVEVYDFRKCQNEPGFFATVDLVVGTHGAGLARLLELIPSDHVYPYFYTLANSAELEFHYLVGESSGSRPPGTLGPSPFDFRIDIQELRQALEGIQGSMSI